MPFFSIYLNNKKIKPVDRYADKFQVSTRETVNRVCDLGLICIDKGISAELLLALSENKPLWEWLIVCTKK